MNLLEKKFEALLDYTKVMICELMDSNAELRVQIYILTQALINKRVFKQEEIDSILSKENIQAIMNHIDERLKKEEKESEN